jgi:hypothetical protein
VRSRILKRGETAGCVNLPRCKKTLRLIRAGMPFEGGELDSAA